MQRVAITKTKRCIDNNYELVVGLDVVRCSP